MTEILIISGAVVVACFLVWALIKASEAKGASKERLEAIKDALDEVKKANEAAASVDALPADERRRRLQQWSRD